MIITLSRSHLNQLAAGVLRAEVSQTILDKIAPIDKLDPEDHTLTLLNLDANGREQHFFAPNLLAKKLVSSGLLKYIQDLNLLISDIVPDKPMLSYATELSYCIIALLPDSNITIHVLADLTNCTLIEPPQQADASWNIRSLPNNEMMVLPLPEKDGVFEGNFEFYRSKMPHITYQGLIMPKLQSSEYAINPNVVRSTYGAANTDADVEDLFSSKPSNG